MEPLKYRNYSIHPLMQRYRHFRRGILTLIALESMLKLDLQELSKVHIAVSKVPVEREFIINSLRTIRQEIRLTYQSLASLKRSIEKSQVTQNDVEKAILKELKNSPYSADILVRIKNAGGVFKFLGAFMSFLRPRYDEYSKCIDLAYKYYDDQMESVTIAEVAIKLESCNPPSPEAVFSALCFNPLSCIVSAVVIIGTLVIAPEDAHGDDEGDDEGDLGDFPQPDPDGDRPV